MRLLSPLEDLQGFCRGSARRGLRGCLGDPGCPKVPPAPFEPHAVLINLGQNDYGKPAHVDPSTGKPVKNHLPPTAMWVRNYAWFLGNITAAQKTAPEFFLACGGMQDK